MRLRQAALPAGLIALLIASAVLVIKTSGLPDVSLDADKLAEARAAHNRRQAATPRSAPPPPRARAPRAEPATPTPEPEREPPRRERPERERSRPTLSAAQPSSSGEVEIEDVRQPFDRGQFLEALELAEDFLARNPDQAYIRRIAVTSACATGQLDTARRYYDQMDERDQRTSEQRCARWGVEF